MPAKVSVIIPAHNCQSTIGYTIESVLFQTFRNLELVIIDDGSTDQTAKVVNKYKDQRIMYYYQDNQERAIARNNGIALASGEYIAFLDSDDIWLPEKLDNQIKLMEKKPESDFVYTDLYYFDSMSGKNVYRYGQKEKLFSGRLNIRELLKNNFIQSPTPLLRRQVLTTSGLFDPKIVPVEDWDLWLRIAKDHKIELVNKPLARYRVDKNSNHGQTEIIRMLSGIHRVLDNVENQPDLYGNIGQYFLNRCRSLAEYKCAVELIRENRKKEAQIHLVKAIRLNPFYLKVYIRATQTIWK
jgi:glycosyltransferase involved in cell wall biosynthesis